MNSTPLGATIVVITGLVAALDLWTSAALIGSILFTLPLALCALVGSRRLLWGTAGAAALLTVAAERWGFDRAEFPGSGDIWYPMINRGLLIASLLTLTTFIHLSMNKSRKIVLDTAELKRQGGRLAEASGFLNNILESSTEYAIIAKDLEGRILTWNEGARRHYGYTAEEMVGKANASVLECPRTSSPAGCKRCSRPRGTPARRKGCTNAGASPVITSPPRCR
jgi:PAS domain-containing protein